ncbi:MAG: type 1 glutamine amidotransferase, partial [Candidatus Bipolaricaulota bacterium]
MIPRLLVFDNTLDPTRYRPVEEWTRNFAGIAFDAVRVPLGEPIPALRGYTHLLITGSQASAAGSSEPWIAAEADAVRQAADLGLAILGSCFGHQLLALAISGPRCVRRAPSPELGWIAVEIFATGGLL